MEKQSNISGVIVVNKPENITSRDVVNRVSKVLGTKKVGHTGTLDPLATGVLVCTIGKCTKLSDFLMSTHKKYSTSMVLGLETDTLDITGEKVLESNKRVTNEEVLETVNSYVGTYSQEVPIYSAVKVDGKKLYEYARSGAKIETPSKLVEIKEISNINIDLPKVSFDVCVSKGTYIRSLIRDIGRSLGTYATMESLNRTMQGGFSLKESYSLEDIEKGCYKIISPEELLKNTYSVNMDDDLHKKVSNGVPIEIDIDEEYVLFKKGNKAVALYKKDNKKFRTYVMF